jgi:signal transduction histidine kinase
MTQRLLLVDDEPGILRVLSISLADRGYLVSTAQNGEEALSLFRQLRPGIVLTDIKMPGMNGIELLQKIKEEHPDTEVIMITGHGDLDLAVRSLKADASDFIAKPISEEALEVALRRAEGRIFNRRRLQEYTERLERLVEEKTGELIHAERFAAVGQTVSALAHAIKNIAAGLTGGVFVLEKGIELDNRTYLLQGWEMVKGNVTKIKGMALDLLNYAKDRTPEYQYCDPNLPAQEVYSLMLARASEMGVSLRTSLDTGIPKAWLDPEGIHRVLLNLVTNAIDACTDLSCATRACEVLLGTTKPEGWAVEYRVTDNGCGMGEETRNKVFQSFFSTKGSKGTGLGLMIARKIVNEHGGVIEFHSEEGKGACMIVRLPEKKQMPVAGIA